MQNKLAKIYEKVLQLTSEADRFLIDQPEVYEDVKQMLQQFHGLLLEDESAAKRVLPELFIDGMDEEQIWQQIEMYNNLINPKIMKSASKMLTLQPELLKFCLNDNGKDCVLLQQANAEPETPVSQPIAAKIEEETDEFNNHGSTEDVKLKKQRNAKNSSKTIVDDEFFKLNEMEEFLKIEERKEGKLPNDDYIDYFADDLGCENSKMDESEDNVTYNDFYCNDSENDSENDHDDIEEEAQSDENDHALKELNPENESHDFQDSDSNCSNSGPAPNKKDEKQMSSYELRLMSLKHQTEQYEEELLGEKHWTLKGEVQAKNRPQNAILEEFLDFDSTIRPPPLITEKTTQCLEHIIQKRIKDKSWDDVQRKVRPSNEPMQYRKELILQQEKSKESLVTIYEREYQNQLQSLDKNQATEIEDKEEHQKIKNLMHNLFIKLNALTNFHFVPKPVAPETKIITNTPAIHMEEVAPVALSDVKLLAPTEVFKGPKGELLGKTELTKSFKKHALRVKKSKQARLKKSSKAKDMPIGKSTDSSKSKMLSHRMVQKIKPLQDEKSIKSSKILFNKLQNERNGISNNKSKMEKENNTQLVKRLKL